MIDAATALLLGIGVGFVFGAFTFRWFIGGDMRRLRELNRKANELAAGHCHRATNLHRRAQKAEGRIERARNIFWEDDEG